MVNQKRPISDFTNGWKYYRDPTEAPEFIGRARAVVVLGALIVTDVAKGALEHARDIVGVVCGEEAPEHEE